MGKIGSEIFIPRLARFHCTMIRWAVYIVIRSLVIVIWVLSIECMSYEYEILVDKMLIVFRVYLLVFYFTQYVYYSKLEASSSYSPARG